MSTVQVSNITDGTSSVETVYVARGSAKAWVNFNGTGTIAARDSLNVSSLTDNGTGDYTVNFSSAFAAADYQWDASLVNDGTGDASRTVVLAGYILAGSFRYSQLSPAGAANDTQFCCTSQHGDLA